MTELDFFEEIYKGCHGYVYLWTKQDKTTHSYLLDPGVSKKIWNMARMLSGMRKDVYFSLGTTADPLPADLRAKQQNVTSIACLWVDIDIVDSAAHKAGKLPKSGDEAMGLLPEKYPPSIIVSSGHGLHAYWLLKDTVIINDENRAEVINAVRKLQQIIRNNAVANGWKIAATADFSRILRVPYTWNFKAPETPMLCEVIEYADLRPRPAALVEKTIEEFKNHLETKESNLGVTSLKKELELGDIITSVDDITGLSIETEITRKILTIENGIKKIEYKVGE